MKELKVTLGAQEYSRLQEEKRILEERCALLEKQKEGAEKELVSLSLEKSTLEAENKLLRWQVADLKRRQWGKSSEKRTLPEDAFQLNICFDAPVDVSDPVSEKKQSL